MESINIMVRSLIIAAALHLHIPNMKKTRLPVCLIASLTINTWLDLYMY